MISTASHGTPPTVVPPIVCSFSQERNVSRNRGKGKSTVSGLSQSDPPRSWHGECIGIVQEFRQLRTRPSFITRL